MSVVIKNLEMPKSCSKCQFVSAFMTCMFTGSQVRLSESERHKDCWLREVDNFVSDSRRCSVCGQTFEPTNNGETLCDICKEELKRVVELSREGLI